MPEKPFATGEGAEDAPRLSSATSEPERSAPPAFNSSPDVAFSAATKAYANFLRAKARASVAKSGDLLRAGMSGASLKASAWVARVGSSLPSKMTRCLALARKLRPTWTWRPPRLGLRRLWRSLGVAMTGVVVLASGFALYCLATLPINGGLQPEATQSALTFQAEGGSAFATRGVLKGDKLIAGDVPPALAQAIVAIEDRRFYQHYGVDPRGLARAAFRNAQAGGTREGGSTITQQLVRLMFLSQERSLRRKAQEAMLAFWLESKLTKDEILLRYLNTAYFGAGAYGVDAASKRYFGKHARELTLAEAAMLAGLVRAPSQLSPTRNFGGAKERAGVVLQAMVETGAITAQEAAAAAQQSVSMITPPETPPGANYFVDMVAGDVRRLLGSAAGDMTLGTTLNMELQRAAEAVIERRLEADGDKKGVSQASLVALSPDGAVLALVGGRDYETSQFNRATQAKRQPGSLFKLFVYLTAFQKGFTPGSVLVDRPTQIGDWEPQNSTGRFRGPVTLRTAFAQSINTIAAQLADEVGIPAVAQTAKNMGVQSPLPLVPSLALGSAEVTLMEMTRAFAAVSAGVQSLEPYTVRSIRGGGQQSIYTHPPTNTEASGRLGESRAMILDLLQAVVTDGTGKAARLPGVMAAGKTGTTQEYRDAWFMGFTPEITVGVWVGNDNNEPMRKVVGGDLPATIWRDFVNRAAPLMARKGASPQPTAIPTVPQSPPRVDTQVRGVPTVIDTGTLDVGGKVVRLAGVQGEGGRMASRLAQYLRRREISCGVAPGAQEGSYRCRFGNDDLAEVIIGGGGARARADATAEALAAEEQARAARLGVWRRNRD